MKEKKISLFYFIFWPNSLFYLRNFFNIQVQRQGESCGSWTAHQHRLLLRVLVQNMIGGLYKVINHTIILEKIVNKTCPHYFLLKVILYFQGILVSSMILNGYYPSFGEGRSQNTRNKELMLIPTKKKKELMLNTRKPKN